VILSTTQDELWTFFYYQNHGSEDLILQACVLPKEKHFFSFETDHGMCNWNSGSITCSVDHLTCNQIVGGSIPAMVHAIGTRCYTFLCKWTVPCKYLLQNS